MFPLTAAQGGIPGLLYDCGGECRAYFRFYIVHTVFVVFWVNGRGILQGEYVIGRRMLDGYSCIEYCRYVNKPVVTRHRVVHYGCWLAIQRMY